MAEINLLPWREALRTAAKKEFLIISAVILCLGIFILALVLNVIKTKMQHQQALNSELQQKRAVLGPKIAAITAIKIELGQLNAKQKALEKLQLQRRAVVQLLEQIVYQIPSGVYLTRLDKKGVQLSFEGIAESNVRISEFMKKMTETKEIAAPHLVEVKIADGKEGSRKYYFKMTAQCLSLREEK